MPIDFPSSPTTNQVYTYNGKAWVFNGTAWLGAGFVGVNASSANTASYVVQRDASGDFSAGKITLGGSGSSTSAQLVFSGSTNNWIDLGTNGYNPPQFTTRSTGTKVVFYKDLTASSTDYAAGIQINALWFSIPAATEDRAFKFYGGITNIASLTGDGSFSAIKKVTGETLGSTVAIGTAPITVVSTTQVTNLNASLLQGYSTATANTVSTIVRRDASGNFSGGTITASLNGNATNVSGIVNLANGGTGQTTANAAANALLPAQTGNTGKYLTSNGTDSSWATVSGTTIPSASMQMFAGAVSQTVSAGVVTTTAPVGWLLANGNAVSRTTYSALFTALGGTSTPYGYDATTFNLPDMRGRSPIGVGTGSGLTARTLAATTGAETVTLVASNIPSITTGTQSANHTHSGTTGGISANHYHQNYSDGVGSGTMGRGSAGFSGVGGGYAGYLIVGSGQNNSSTSYTGYVSSDHNHTITTGNESANHSHTYTNNSLTATSIMQPAIAINFIIKT